MAVASTTTLVAAHYMEAVKATHLAAVVSSAINVHTSDDIILTTAAATDEASSRERIRHRSPPASSRCSRSSFLLPSQKASFRHPRRLPPAVAEETSSDLPPVSVDSSDTRFAHDKHSLWEAFHHHRAKLFPFARDKHSLSEAFPLEVLSFLSEAVAYLSSRAKIHSSALTVLFVARFFTLFNSTANVIKDRDSLKYRWRNIKKIYHIYEQLRTRSGWGWDDERNLHVAPDEESIQAAIGINSEFKKYIDKPFSYKRQLDILCGKTTVRGSHFMGSTQEVDVEARRSFGDDDSVDREQFNAMGLESSQFYLIDGDNFNPFDFPSSSQPNPPSWSVGEKTPTNIHPVEDEATSPARRRNDHASTCSRKRKSKKSFDPNLLSQYERINMVRALFPSSSNTSSTPQEQCTMRECVVRMKSLPGYNQQLLFLASTLFEKPEKRAWFMALDDEDALAWILNATS
ncbi:hypothetical protein Taro_012844 [Colocasia esculenta]|uniref:Myb/SANT-like domain-containing protein n=1 Tax=Colocasia esculenta TaxID=4460 RepID=A0A843UEM8_COLES|nr:hypothetical protein [Colocasia esculenta]